MDSPHLSEKEPLRSAFNRLPRGSASHSHIHSHYLLFWSMATPHNRLPPSFSTRRLSPLLLLVTMVALPAYLLASSAVPFLGPLTPRNTVIRSRQPDSEPGTDPNDPFGSVLGPVISTNFPDPAIIWVDGVSYAFSTNNRGVGSEMIHVQMATSTDNETWTLLDRDAMPQVGAWESGARVWAPDVIQLVSRAVEGALDDTGAHLIQDDGTFVLYYADELVRAPAHHCVGVATSKSVMGPYVPRDTPFACPDVHTLGGAIDPDGFRDPASGKRYVTYKVDGNSIGHGGTCNNMVPPIVPTPIMLQEVGEDGITLVGDAIQILDRDARDGPLIEAPSLHRSDEGIYFLFFSSNCFTTPLYDTSYATATNIQGPYTKAGRPLIVTSDGPDLVGPGGLDIIPGGEMVLFHGHMTVNNDPARKQQVEDASKKSGKPVQDIHLPLVRGMYSGVATFRGTTVSLA